MVRAHSGLVDSRMISQDTKIMLIACLCLWLGSLPIVPVARAPASDSPKMNFEGISFQDVVLSVGWETYPQDLNGALSVIQHMLNRIVSSHSTGFPDVDLLPNNKVDSGHGYHLADHQHVG